MHGGPKKEGMSLLPAAGLRPIFPAGYMVHASVGDMTGIIKRRTDHGWGNGGDPSLSEDHVVSGRCQRYSSRSHGADARVDGLRRKGLQS